MVEHVALRSLPLMKMMPIRQLKRQTAKRSWDASLQSVYLSLADRKLLLVQVRDNICSSFRVQAISPRPLIIYSSSSAQTDMSQRTKLYVGNLSFYTTLDTVEEFFAQYGEVHDAYLPEDNETGGSRGFAFVTMDNEGAQTAIEETDGYELDGR